MQGAVGGTFNILHKGHKALLSHAIQLCSLLHVGITSDRMALENRSNLRPYSQREKDVTSYLDSRIKQGANGGEYKIRQIDDVVGFAAEPGFAILIVSQETRAGASKINEARTSKGMTPLRLHIIGRVLADDGVPISATRIARGETDTEGHLTRPIRVTAATSAPSKIEGITRAFQRVFQNVDVKKVDTHITETEQPVGMAQIKSCTKTRIEHLSSCNKESSDPDYMVGMEHGILEDGTGIHLCLIQGRTGMETYGQSPGYSMPPWIQSAAQRGESVSAEVKRMLGKDDIGKHGGITGLLSGDILTRENLAEQATLAALLPWIRTDLYGLEEM